MPTALPLPSRPRRLIMGIVVMSAAIVSGAFVVDACWAPAPGIHITLIALEATPGDSARLEYRVIVQNDTAAEGTVRVNVTLDPDVRFVPEASSPEWGSPAAGVASAQDDGPSIVEASVLVPKGSRTFLPAGCGLLEVSGLCTSVDIDPGQRSLDLVVDTGSLPVEKTAIALSAHATMTNDEGTLTVNESLTLLIADVSVTTEVTVPQGGPRPGDVIVYQHTVTNPIDRAISVRGFTNVVPAGTSFDRAGSRNSASLLFWTVCGDFDDGPHLVAGPEDSCAQVELFLDPHETRVIPFAVRIDPDYASAEPIINTAVLGTAIEDDGILRPRPRPLRDPNLNNNTSRVETPVVLPAAFTVTNTPSPQGIGAPGPITYTVVVENTGGAALTNLTFDKSNLAVLFGPAIQTGGSGDNTNAVLDIGETWTFHGVYLVPEAAFTANGFDTQGNPDNDGDIDNTVTVSASGPDGPLPSQTASARVEIETWATGALQISTTRGDSSPDAATGLPDTLGCSDSPATAWTPEIDDSPASGLPPQTVILQVNFAPANFHATGIEIHESFESGSVVLIELLDENGVGIGDPTHQVYSSAVDGGPDPEDSTACPGVFRITFPQTPYAVSSAWIYTERPGFEQIDAVRLIGVTVTP